VSIIEDKEDVMELFEFCDNSRRLFVGDDDGGGGRDAVGSVLQPSVVEEDAQDAILITSFENYLTLWFWKC